MTRMVSPVIITGTQRSGTTLLHHIVGCSKQIWSRNEMFEVHRLMFDDVQGSRERALRDQLQTFLGCDLSSIPLSETLDGRCRFLDASLKRAAKKAGKDRWCLKDPRATYYLQQYAEGLPTAKFVILVRDPRAVCRSYLDRRGFTVGRPANWLAGAERWTHEVECQLAHHEQYSDRVLIVRYDLLVKNMEEEIKRLCEFLEIEYEGRLLKYYDHATKINMHNGNENILTPPNPDKVDAWKTALTRRQIQTIESAAHKTMAGLGFKLCYSPRRISIMQQLFSKIHDRLTHEYRWQLHKWSKK